MVFVVIVVAAAFFALSPLAGETFSGQIPWGSNSLLRSVTEAMSLWHVLESARGVEIKDIAFHIGAVLIALLAGFWFFFRKTEIHFQRHFRQPWFHALILLLLWVGMSFWSATWSSDPPSSISQATLYGFCVAWAAGLALTLRPPQIHAAHLAFCIMIAVAAGLCVWYYHERNPMHRPGFPVGNPATLSASILPGAMLTIAFLSTTAAHLWRAAPAGNAGRAAPVRVPPVVRIMLCATALLAMAWCIWLASSRSTLIGLVVAIGVLAFFRLRTRWRWAVLVGLLLLLVAAAFWFLALSSQDISMARGATIRYRLYTWRYASELWQRTPSIGQGAGAYPRLAGELSALDRALDPGAFLGEIVSHAHNEMFEVFAEIGLIGGVTWVGGMVATAYAALRALRFRRNSRAYWPSVAMLATFIGLLADSMFSAGMRLPGLPAIFWTVVGLIWADARAVAREHLASVTDVLDARERPRTLRTIGAGLACIGASASLAVAAWNNLLGVQAEARSVRAARSGNQTEVYQFPARAHLQLLDPVRRLLDRDRRVSALLRESAKAVVECLSGDTDRPPQATAPATRDAACTAADKALSAAHAEATELLRITRGWYRSAAYLAQVAELRVMLLRKTNDAAVAQWSRQAYAAWQKQRQWLPYDFQTLMRLTHYPATADAYAALLRDALRSDDLEPQAWRARLAEVAAIPGFATAIDRQLQSASPLTPESDLDLLVGRMIPETYRLAAAWEAQRRNWSSALDLSRTAVEMYQPMRVRFPTMASHALAELAEYQFLSDPGRAAEAVATLRESIAQLPEIQQQKYDDLARPFRETLATCLLAAGELQSAREMRAMALGPDAASDAELSQKLVELSAAFIRASREHRSIIARWLDLALQLQPDNFSAWSWTAWLAAEVGGWQTVDQVLVEARRAGLNEDQIDRIRRSLADFFGPASQPAVSPS